MWFAKIFDDSVLLNIDKKERYIRIKNCCYITKYNDVFYLLCHDNVLCFSEKSNKMFFSVDSDSNVIKVENNIYISGEDTGCIYIYNFNGELCSLTKIGEHLADFEVFDDFVYGITYNDNILIKTDLKEKYKKIFLDMVPQRIIVKKYIYLLLNDGYYSVIKMLDTDLNIRKFILFERQIGDLFFYFDKIIFSGTEYNYILSENLTILSKKKSTGEILCRFGDIPIFEKSKGILDTVNNIIYPL